MKSLNIKNYFQKFILVKLYLLIKTKAYYFIENLKMVLRKILNIQYIPDIFNNINIETSSVCNLGCRFCGYTKRDENRYPFKVMSDEDFNLNVKQAEIYGFKNVGLSPVSGDIFMDKNISNKLNILENANIEGYYFYTNFIATNLVQIDNLFKYKKIKFIGLSIYGHDEKSHIKIAQSNSVSYLRLIKNLGYLYNKIKVNNFNFTISIDQRDAKNFNLYKDNSELSIVIKKIIGLKNKNIKYEFETNYNNWGGLIKKKDINGLGIDLNDENKFKVGACSLLFSRLIIGADNTVNACACRDANYSLRIGNTKKNSLREIISIRNKKYQEIINNHEKGHYPEICKSCDFYTSIYSKKHNLGLVAVNKPKIKLNDFYKILKSRVDKIN